MRSDSLNDRSLIAGAMPSCAESLPEHSGKSAIHPRAACWTPPCLRDTLCPFSVFGQNIKKSFTHRPSDFWQVCQSDQNKVGDDFGRLAEALRWNRRGWTPLPTLFWSDCAVAQLTGGHKNRYFGLGPKSSFWPFGNGQSYDFAGLSRSSSLAKSVWH